MREVHAALAGGRPARALRRRRVVRRGADHRADAPQGGHGVPGGKPPALAVRHRQRRLPLETTWDPQGRAAGGGRAHAHADRAGRLRGQAAASALGRHETAGGDRPRPRAGPRGAAHGRAVRVARRADAHAAGRRAAPDLVRDAQDGDLRHAQPERGGVPRRPRRGAEPAAGPHRRRRHRGSATPPELRDDVHRALRCPEGPDLAAHPQRGARDDPPRPGRPLPGNTRRVGDLAPRGRGAPALRAAAQRGARRPRRRAGGVLRQSPDDGGRDPRRLRARLRRRHSRGPAHRRLARRADE